MDALTERTIRRLSERLEAFRLKGPIPALMAEFRVGAPAEETQPLDGFADALWSGSMRYLPDGTNLSRHIWLAADPPLVNEFRNFCGDAGRLAVPLLLAAGYHVGSGAPKPEASWLWAAFELAELRLPGTDLRLVGETVWRMGAGRVAIGEGVLDNPGPFAGLAANVGNTRYWKLADAVEASLAVLDIAQVRQETVAAATQPQTVAAATGRRHATRSTRKKDVDGALGKLEAKMRKELVREHGSESAAQVALIESLYSLSAEALVPMLKGVGFKTSARTIYRPGNSRKYESWARYRRPSAPAATDVDVGPAHSTSDLDVEDSTEGGGDDDGDADDPTIRLESGHRPTAADAADDAVDAGNLSIRSGGRGTTHIRKTAAERAAGRAGDEFARANGVELPPDD